MWKEKVDQLKREIHALYLACRHVDTPWYAKLLALLVVGYALSPIDLIPDFIPVLGYLDDLLLLPLGIALVLKTIPDPVLNECRAQARKNAEQRLPKSRLAGGVIAVIWLLACGLCLLVTLRFLHRI